MIKNSLLRTAFLMFAVAAVSVMPALSSPSRNPCDHHAEPDLALDWFNDQQTQKQVFSGHDGHIGPPTAEDWARYQDAEAKLNADKSLYPCLQWQDRHHRHKH